MGQALTTWTDDAQTDADDINTLISVISEIDDKLHDIIGRLEALERE